MTDQKVFCTLILPRSRFRHAWERAVKIGPLGGTLELRETFSPRKVMLSCLLWEGVEYGLQLTEYDSRRLSLAEDTLLFTAAAPAHELGATIVLRTVTPVETCDLLRCDFDLTREPHVEHRREVATIAIVQGEIQIQAEFQP